MKIEAIRKMSQTELAAEETKLKKELFPLISEVISRQTEFRLRDSSKYVRT